MCSGVEGDGGAHLAEHIDEREVALQRILGQARNRHLAADGKPTRLSLVATEAAGERVRGAGGELGVRLVGNVPSHPDLRVVGVADERWGQRIASWGYAVLSVDSLGPRGLKTCEGRAPNDSAEDAYRALNFLVGDPLVYPDRVAVIGFANGGRVALMSVERGYLIQASPAKFRAAVAFYPSCLGLKGEMTAPALILIGEFDDWASARECRNLAEGHGDWGISRQKDKGVPIVITTGFEEVTLPDVCAGTPILRKPYRLGELEAVIANFR